MKYYSEHTHSIYNSIEALRAAEAEQRKQKKAQVVLVDEYCALLDKLTVTMQEFFKCVDKVEKTVTDEVLIQKIAEHGEAMMDKLLPEFSSSILGLGI